MCLESISICHLNLVRTDLHACEADVVDAHAELGAAFGVSQEIPFEAREVSLAYSDACACCEFSVLYADFSLAIDHLAESPHLAVRDDGELRYAVLILPASVFHEMQDEGAALVAFDGLASALSAADEEVARTYDPLHLLVLPDAGPVMRLLLYGDVCASQFLVERAKPLGTLLLGVWSDDGDEPFLV